MDGVTETASEVAAWLRCSRAKIYKLARENGIGMNLGGRAGWRFTAADKLALQRALRPTKQAPTQIRRPKRRRR